ncbi:MAG: glycoside hydrolase family 92 protein, partial [Bacteroidales bacterium]
PVVVTDYLRNEQQIVLSAGDEKSLLLKIGTSFTSFDGARANLDSEIKGWDFDAVRKETEGVWNQTLGKIVVRGTKDDDKIKFYSALYHCYQLPRIVSDADGSYQGFAQDTTIHKAIGFDYYDDFSMWDTYRALHPLMTILEPVRTRDMVRSLVLKAQQGGWMPIFPAWANYTAAMIGDHVSTMIADSYLKGITDFDTEEAFKYMRKNAFESPSEAEYRDGKGRRALKSYLQYGYIPLEDSVWEAFHKNEQVSRTLEYALDDYALSRFAGALGKEKDASILAARASNWKNVFDATTGFARGRYANGKWIEPFDPYRKQKYICEGTPFHYTWYVPQDVNGLATAMGGNKAFVDKLNLFFSDGHYWHGNEPGHQAPFMFALGGEPSLTQKWVQNIINDEYGTSPGGLSGNEDAGQMSAWLVFAMMGFYPVCPASGEYVMSTPSFDEVRIILPGSKNFIISSLNRVPGTNYIKAVTMNGGRYPNWTIKHEDIVKGARFTLQLDSRPPFK